MVELNQPSSVVEAVLQEEAALLQELLQELNQPSGDAAPPVYCEAALWEEALPRALSRALRGVGPWEAAANWETALWEAAVNWEAALWSHGKWSLYREQGHPQRHWGRMSGTGAALERQDC